MFTRFVAISMRKESALSSFTFGCTSSSRKVATASSSVEASGRVCTRRTIEAPMKSLTEYLWFETKQKRELIRVTDTVEQAVAKSQVQEGMALVSAMHITAGVFINDDEPGLWQDIWDWLQ